MPRVKLLDRLRFVFSSKSSSYIDERLAAIDTYAGRMVAGSTGSRGATACSPPQAPSTSPGAAARGSSPLQTPPRRAARFTSPSTGSFSRG
jgi:hypothetical protein